MREVFSLRTCVADSRRVSASAYFGKRGVTMSVCLNSSREINLYSSFMENS